MASICEYIYLHVYMYIYTHTHSGRNKVHEQKQQNKPLKNKLRIYVTYNRNI